MSKESEFLTRLWNTVYSGPVPDNVKKQFEYQIAPMLKTASTNDPYIVDATSRLITNYLLSQSVSILQENARSSEDLEKSVNGILKSKLLISASGLVSASLVCAVVLVVLSFSAGATVGSWGADSWNASEVKTAEIKRQTALQLAEKEQQIQRDTLEFLKKVGADVLQCKGGKITTQDGRKLCFFENGFYITPPATNTK